MIITIAITTIKLLYNIISTVLILDDLEISSLGDEEGGRP